MRHRGARGRAGPSSRVAGSISPSRMARSETRARPRSASAIGANGKPSSESKADAAAFEDQVAPVAGSRRRAPGRAGSCRSPPRRRRARRPATPSSARPSASSSAAISGTRPIRIGLESRALISRRSYGRPPRCRGPPRPIAGCDRLSPPRRGEIRAARPEGARHAAPDRTARGARRGSRARAIGSCAASAAARLARTCRWFATTSPDRVRAERPARRARIRWRVRLSCRWRLPERRRRAPGRPVRDLGVAASAAVGWIASAPAAPAFPARAWQAAAPWRSSRQGQGRERGGWRPGHWSCLRVVVSGIPDAPDRRQRMPRAIVGPVRLDRRRRLFWGGRPLRRLRRSRDRPSALAGTRQLQPRARTRRRRPGPPPRRTAGRRPRTTGSCPRTSGPASPPGAS